MSTPTFTDSLSIVFLLGALLLGGCSTASELSDRARAAAEEASGQAVTREVGDRTDDAVSGAFDTVEDAVRCAIGDDACIEKAQREGKPVVVEDENGSVVREIPGDEGAYAITGAHSNYDFEPGDRVLFEEDFSSDQVGDFPRRLEFVNGSWEVVEWQDRRFLRNTSNRSAFRVPLPETLPERFTIEFDAHFRHPNQQLAVATLEPERGRIQHLDDHNFFHFTNAKSGVGVSGDGAEALQRLDEPFANEVVRARIMVDGAHAKVYVGEQRVANVPRARLDRSNSIWFENTYFADADHPLYIGTIRIAAGGRDLYNTLDREGRVALRAIEFDTGSAQLRPSSADELEKIGQMLRTHPKLRLEIEGHTDSQGDDRANRRLSQRRAESVKQFLVREHGIDAARLEAVGRGEADPVAPNDTSAGRQQNRRVELVRL